jgi:hypothetical protein
MEITRKVAGYILVVAGLLFILVHVLLVGEGDVSGLPTFLGIGFILLMFGILTSVACMMGEKECEVEAP